MLRGRLSVLVGSLTAFLVASTMLVSSAAAQQPITIQLGSQNNSGISGTAVLTPMGDQTRVTLTVQGSPQGGNHPAHIHEGSCANLNPRPKFPLTNVQNGTSETVVNASIDQIRSMQHAINVHKSPQEASVYVACGNLPTAAVGMPRTGAGGGTGQSNLLIGLGVLLAATGGLLAVSRRRAA